MVYIMTEAEMEDKMENVFKNSAGKIGFTEPMEKLTRRVLQTEFGKTKVGFGVIFACAAASNLFTWPIQVADVIANTVDPDHFGPSIEKMAAVEKLSDYLENR